MEARFAQVEAVLQQTMAMLQASEARALASEARVRALETAAAAATRRLWRNPAAGGRFSGRHAGAWQAIELLWG